LQREQQQQSLQATAPTAAAAKPLPTWSESAAVIHTGVATAVIVCQWPFTSINTRFASSIRAAVDCHLPPPQSFASSIRAAAPSCPHPSIQATASSSFAAATVIRIVNHSRGIFVCRCHQYKPQECRRRLLLPQSFTSSIRAAAPSSTSFASSIRAKIAAITIEVGPWLLLLLCCFLS
jgi:hypothetical protein